MEKNWQMDVETKKLVYVEVYEKMYQMVTDGTFPVGSRLPPEPKLAQMLGVSRMTLRQALGLLHDDGLIKKVQGAGNFVMSGNRSAASNLEQFGQPVYNCCNETIDRMDMDFRIEPPTPFAVEVLKQKSPVIVSVDRWYYSKECLSAYTYTMVPIETVARFGLDLNDKESLREFVETGVYEKGTRSALTFHPDSVGAAIVKDKMPKGAHITLLLENVYGEEYTPLIHNKHYFRTEAASFVVNVYKENRLNERKK